MIKYGKVGRQPGRSCRSGVGLASAELRHRDTTFTLEEALKKTLLSAKSIGYSSPAERRLSHRPVPPLGVADQIQSKLQQTADRRVRCSIIAW